MSKQIVIRANFSNRVLAIATLKDYADTDKWIKRLKRGLNEPYTVIITEN
ncbi:MAG: hypothetical protein QM751_06185 [Paludibacteraceae bacterium]